MDIIPSLESAIKTVLAATQSQAWSYAAKGRAVHSVSASHIGMAADAVALALLLCADDPVVWTALMQGSQSSARTWVWIPQTLSC